MGAWMWWVAGAALAEPPVFRLLPGEAGVAGARTRGFAVAPEVQGDDRVQIMDGLVLRCRASGGRGFMALDVDRGIDWAAVPADVQCTVGGATWSAGVIVEDAAQDASAGGVRVRWDGDDIEVVATSPDVHGARTEVAVGDVRWALPAEVLVGAALRIPLVIPPEPPHPSLVRDRAWPMEVTVLAIDASGTVVGRVVAAPRTLRWTDGGPVVR